MEPAVQGIKPNRPIPINSNKSNFGIFSLIKRIFFGDIKPKNQYKRKSKNYNPNYKGKKFNKNYKNRNNKFSKGKQYNKKS